MKRTHQFGVVKIGCSVCGREDVEDRGAGSYRCRHCGYDTDIDYPKDIRRTHHQLQELAIAIQSLESAAHSFKHSNFAPQKQEDPERREQYRLDGYEQIQEVIDLLLGVVGAHERIGEAISLLGSAQPSDSSFSAGELSTQDGHDALDAISRATPIIVTSRRALLDQLIS
ncbi:MAG: hypothetical protein AAFV53_08580 [Myxococcota bacterium]